MLVEKKYKEGDIVTLVILGAPEVVGVFVSEDETTITLTDPAYVMNVPPSEENPDGGYNFGPFSVTGRTMDVDVMINKSSIISCMKSWQGHADNYTATLAVSKASVEGLRELEQED